MSHIIFFGFWIISENLSTSILQIGGPKRFWTTDLKGGRTQILKNDPKTEKNNMGHILAHQTGIITSKSGSFSPEMKIRTTKKNP